MNAGIDIQGLKKTYRGPGGPVPAVKGIDVSIAPGETVALLGPNGAGKSTTIDMLLGLAEPDTGTVTVFGRPPREAVDAGLVGGMLQTGSLIRDLTVRELVVVMASLYPDPLDVDEVIELTGLKDAAGQRTQKLSGGQTQRARFAIALVANPALLVLDEPTVAMDVEGRRDFWTTMREYASPRQDRALRHALPRGGRRQRRPRGDDGPGADRRRRPDDRDQGAHRRTARSAPRSPASSIEELSQLDGVATAERHGDAVILRCSDSDRAIRALLDRYPAARDIEITGAALEDAFLELTGDPADAPEQANPMTEVAR